MSVESLHDDFWRTLHSMVRALTLGVGSRPELAARLGELRAVIFLAVATRASIGELLDPRREQGDSARFEALLVRVLDETAQEQLAWDTLKRKSDEGGIS